MYIFTDNHVFFQNLLIEKLKSFALGEYLGEYDLPSVTIEIKQVQNALWGFIEFPLDLVHIVKLETLPSGPTDVDFLDAERLL